MLRYLHTSGDLMINISSSAGLLSSCLNPALSRAVSTALEIILSSSSLSIVNFFDQKFFIRLTHIRESRPEIFFIPAKQRVKGKHADMIPYDHEISYLRSEEHTSELQ